MRIFCVMTPTDTYQVRITTRDLNAHFDRLGTPWHVRSRVYDQLGYNLHDHHVADVRLACEVAGVALPRVSGLAVI